MTTKLDWRAPRGAVLRWILPDFMAPIFALQFSRRSPQTLQKDAITLSGFVKGAVKGRIETRSSGKFLSCDSKLKVETKQFFREAQKFEVSASKGTKTWGTFDAAEKHCRRLAVCLVG